MFKIQDVGVLRRPRRGSQTPNGLWGTIEDSGTSTGTHAIAQLIKAVVHHPHGVVAANIAAIGQIEAVKWGCGMWDSRRVSHSLLVRLQRCGARRSTPYDLAFEALVDTLRRFQHIVTKLTLYWVKFSGDPKEEECRYTNTGASSWWHCGQLWRSLRSAGRPHNKQPLRQHEQGTKGRREEKVHQVANERATPIRATKHAGCSKCTYGKACKFKHEVDGLGRARGH